MFLLGSAVEVVVIAGLFLVGVAGGTCLSRMMPSISRALLQLISGLVVVGLGIRYWSRLGRWVSRAQRMRVEYNEHAISVYEKHQPRWTLAWKDVARIGYRTTNAGPVGDDHFLVFKTAEPSHSYDVSLSWPGALELAEYVHRMDGTVKPPEGTLANCTENKSVTIWPAAHTGEPL